MFCRNCLSLARGNGTVASSILQTKVRQKQMPIIQSNPRNLHLHLQWNNLSGWLRTTRCLSLKVLRMLYSGYTEFLEMLNASSKLMQVVKTQVLYHMVSNVIFLELATALQYQIKWQCLNPVLFRGSKTSIVKIHFAASNEQWISAYMHIWYYPCVSLPCLFLLQVLLLSAVQCTWYPYHPSSQVIHYRSFAIVGPVYLLKSELN